MGFDLTIYKYLQQPESQIHIFFFLILLIDIYLKNLKTRKFAHKIEKI